MSRERRRLFLEEEPSAEPGRYGCPMLTRLRTTFHQNGDQPHWRCSLAWAIRGDLDVARCSATESVIDCWKVHPERTPVVALPTTEVRAEKVGAD